jgi:hypothetical protein
MASIGAVLYPAFEALGQNKPRHDRCAADVAAPGIGYR